MMKNKIRIAVICLAAFLLIILSGWQLALEDMGEEASEDRLIGVLLTTEYLDLFDFDSYVKENISGFPGGEMHIDENTGKYQGRLYAELRQNTLTNTETGEEYTTKKYVFPGIDGIAYYSAWVPAKAEHVDYYASVSDDAVNDGHISVNSSDQGDSITMEGTVYVTPMYGGRFYFNPIYQSRDGRVYTIAGRFLATERPYGEGELFSQTMNATYTTTENGESRTDSISIKLSISMMNAPEKIAVVQMDKESSLVSRIEYTPGEMPDVIVPEKGTEYFIVETRKSGGRDGNTISRKLYGRDAESLEAFFCREDGICLKQRVKIDWNKQS